MGDAASAFPSALLTPANRVFWTGGASGHLHIAQCVACAYRFHPPASVCPRCIAREVVSSAVSGRGSVYSFTIAPEGPHGSQLVVIALIDLVEQEDLRLLSKLVRCEPSAVTIGMNVEVDFERNGELYVPVFRPTLSEGRK